MDFALTPDHIGLTSAFDRLASQFESKPIDLHSFVLAGVRFEWGLVEGQYFDIAAIPDLGQLTAVVRPTRVVGKHRFSEDA